MLSELLPRFIQEWKRTSHSLSDAEISVRSTDQYAQTVFVNTKQSRTLSTAVMARFFLFFFFAFVLGSSNNIGVTFSG